MEEPPQIHLLLPAGVEGNVQSCPVGLVLGVFMVSLCTFLHPSNLHVASCPPLWSVKHTDPQHKAECETCA